MKAYEHKAIEAKWQARWEEARVFATPDLTGDQHGSYILDFFPYPSGSGLHVGHLLGYTGSDVVARTARMQGKKVLHPMGWDAFGLPAENFALQSGVHPAESTIKNIAEYKRQFRQAGISYDWDKEMNTSDPTFYKWTQWLFRFLYEKGLAYRKDGMVNWCPKDQTVLANEQVVGGRCERCGTEVIQKNLKQWYFKITDYSERLLQDLDTIDWPEPIKLMQKNWIGRSEGAKLYFSTKNGPVVEVFTTRPDTIFGVTYLVLAPEHPLVGQLMTDEQKAELATYLDAAKKKSELERLHLDKTKSGVWTGAMAIHPITKAELPVWVSDYVLMGYGTGAVMAVPAHDERDYIFAQTYQLPVVQSIGTGSEALPYIGTGPFLNAGEYTGKNPEEILKQLLDQIGAKHEVRYRLRDWLVSRQRYWGTPIPIAYDEKGTERLVPLSQLPVTLPHDVAFSPTGQSPLFTASGWHQYTDPETGEKLTREADTLDTFVCSSWYYLRFPNPNYSEGPFDPEGLKHWLPVETYMGGAEHAVLHLLYARFITKALFDAGLVSFSEPFLKLRNQGSILGPDHQKMSKSKGNVINPDDVISQFGADTLRTYELFMAPFELEKPWSTESIAGVRRFLEKVWRLQEKVDSNSPTSEEQRVIHKAIKKVTADIADFKFNTCVSTLMETVNSFYELGRMSKDSFLKLITILSPFAPHIAEELWESQGETGFCSVSPWPSCDEQFLAVESWDCPVQINGKVKAKVTVKPGLDVQALQIAVEADPKVQELLVGKTVVKVVAVPDRLISYVLS